MRARLYAVAALAGLILGAGSFAWLEAQLRQNEADAVGRELRRITASLPASRWDEALRDLRLTRFDERYEIHAVLEPNAKPADWSHARRTSEAVLRSASGDVPMQVVIEWHTFHAMAGRGVLWVSLLMPALLSLAAAFAAGEAATSTLSRALANATTEADKYRRRARSLDILLHDLRKPLRAVRQALQNDSRQGVASGPAAELERLAGEVEAALATAKNAGDLAQRPAVTVAAVAVEELIDAAIRQAQAVLGTLDLRFHYEFDHLQKVSVDAGRASRVIANLLTNAAEATRTGGDIWFATAEEDQDGLAVVALTVGNSHSFIAEADRARLFDAFTTRGKSDGIGLGLAGVMEAVTAWGGVIRVRSHVDAGTEFIVTLPLAEGVLSAHACTLPARSTALQTRTASAVTMPKVVLIDDDVFTREVWELACTDANLVTFASPEDLLGRIAREPNYLTGFAAVITDFYFEPPSRLTGADLATKIRAGYQGWIILQTSSILASTEANGVFDHCIEKDASTWAELSSQLKERKAG